MCASHLYTAPGALKFSPTNPTREKPALEPFARTQTDTKALTTLISPAIGLYGPQGLTQERNKDQSRKSSEREYSLQVKTLEILLLLNFECILMCRQVYAYAM